MPTHYVELSGPQAHQEKKASLPFILLLATVALASGIANGYNGTVLEGAIPRLQFQGEMLAPLEVGLLEGALSLGGLLGSLVCSELATALSRRSLVVAGELTIVTGVLLFATVGSAGTFLQALVGRTLTGVGVAVCGLAKPLIVSELAPPARRGLLVSFFAVGQSLGMNVFFLTDWALPPPTVRWAWRVLILLGAAPALAVICLAFVFRDDRGNSPSGYWDVPQRRRAEGGGAQMNGGAAATLRRMLTTEPPVVRRNFGLVIALALPTYHSTCSHAVHLRHVHTAYTHGIHGIHTRHLQGIHTAYTRHIHGIYRASAVQGMYAAHSMHTPSRWLATTSRAPSSSPTMVARHLQL